MQSEISSNNNSSTDVSVFAYYWKAEEITEYSNFHTELRIYGIDDANNNVCVRVDNVKLRIFIEFSDENYVVNNFAKIKNVISELIFNKGDRNTIKIVYKRKLYGSHLNPDGSHKLFPYIEIYFSSRIGMMSVRKNIKELTFPCEVRFHEDKACSELQFMVSRNIQPSGWLLLKKPTEIIGNTKLSTCAHEYLVEQNQVLPSEKSDPVNAKIMAWDIEAKCKDIGKNPGNHVSDCVFQISCVFFSVITKEVRKVLLTLGKCRSFCDDVEIQIFKTEKDLILGFTQLMIREKPNVITGWNIFQFDINFMINRAEHNMCLGEFLSFGFVDTPGEISTMKWESKAFMTTDIKYINAEGILTIDLIEVVRKDYKLDSYSLNNVAKHFLKEEKDDITFKDLMHAYNCFLNNSEDLEEEFTKVGKYCVQDSKLVVDLFDKLQTWLGLSEMSKTTCTPIATVHMNGQQKKFYNQIYRYCYFENIVVESDAYSSKDTDRYTGAYVFDPVPGLYDYVVPLDFASLYPSIIIAYNIDYTTIVTGDCDLDKVTVMEWEDHIGCEHDKLVQQKNILTDIIEKCDDKIKKKEYVHQRSAIVKKLGTKQKKKMCQKNSFKFLKHEYYGKGVLPTIIQNLLDARKEVRKQMKHTTDETTLAILNQRQLSYKISANSMYGATGVRVGSLPFMPVAMCVTYIGRESIQKAAQILSNLGGTIVYGDTDSNYVMFNEIKGTHEEKCERIWDTAVSVANKISENYPSPMKIEFEEVIYFKFMILTKKRYMYYSCKRSGEISKKIGQKGVLLARRDNSKFMKNIYEESVMDVFAGKSKEEVLSNIFNNIFELTEKRLDDNLLKITKSVNDYDECEMKFNDATGKFMMGNYIVPAPDSSLAQEDKRAYCISKLPAQVQLEIKIIDRGQEKSEGSRLEYIVLDKFGATKQSEKIEQYKYYLDHRDMLQVDNIYYITRLVLPLEQVFESVYKTENFISKNIKQFELKHKLNTELKKLFAPKFIVK